MKVRDLMTREPIRLPPDATVARAIAIMVERRISCVLVEAAGEEEPWGIVTRRDVVAKVAARGLDPAAVRLGEVMSFAILAVDPALDVGYASRLMQRFAVRHLPVLQGPALVGILSYHDVLRVFTLLTSVPFFERLPVEDLIALLGLASVRPCPAGHVLIREGDPGGDLFLVEEGEMAVSTRQAGRIARIRAGELFGEMELFGGRRSATVRAVRDSRLLVFDGERFRALAGRRQRLGAVVYESMARLLSERLRRANRFLFLRGLWAHRALVARGAAIAAAIFVILVLGTAGISESPGFCPTCHYMRPYSTSWSASPHHQVTCTACHKSYGLHGALRGKITGVAMVVRYVTHTYAPKPEAKVDDASCLAAGCHDRGAPAWRFQPAGGREVWFNHALHLRPVAGLGTLRCTSCHNHRGQDEHFSVTADACFLCHFGGRSVGSPAAPPPTPCRGCHTFRGGGARAAAGPARVDHGKLGKAADCLACHRNVAQGSAAVEEARCTACHLKPGALGTEEMHRVHVEKEDVDCFDCHGTVGHPGPRDPILAGRCEACHVGEHEAQEHLYLGEGGAGVAGRAALMFYMHVECTACHGVEAAGADSARAPAHGGGMGKVCLDCHDLTSGEQARMWKTTIERSLAEVRAGLRRFEGAAGPDAATRHPEAFRLYAEARQNCEIVAGDPAAAIHNFRYAQDLLQRSRERLAAAGALLGASGGGQGEGR